MQIPRVAGGAHQGKPRVDRSACHVRTARSRIIRAVLSFDPPYTTFNLATVTGGQAINIVPRHAQLTWEYRPVPSDDGDANREQVERFTTEEVLPRLRRDTGVGESPSWPMRPPAP